MMESDVMDRMMGASVTNSRFYGVVIGIVTNNQDPKKLGRVKVKLPWMADDHESDWARVVSPMIGKGWGIYALPEVDEEVLVAFEHGDLRFAYVLGGLWNGRDNPPETNSDGKNNVRSIRSRSGHTIRLDDTSRGEKIEISDGSGKNSIVLDTQNNSITITADADITIRSSSGNLDIQAQAITVEAEADLTLKGQMVNIN